LSTIPLIWQHAFCFEEKMQKEQREHEERIMMGMTHSPSMPVTASPHPYYYNSLHAQFNYQPAEGDLLFDYQERQQLVQ